MRGFAEGFGEGFGEGVLETVFLFADLASGFFERGELQMQQFRKIMYLKKLQNYVFKNYIIYFILLCI